MTQATAAPTGAVGGPAAVDRLGVALVAVALAAFLASLAFLPGRRPRSTARTAADEPQYLLTAISLVEDHDLDIADELGRRPAGATSRRRPPPPDRADSGGSRDQPPRPWPAAAAGRRRWRSPGGSAPRCVLALVNGALAAVAACGRPSAASACRRGVAAPVVLALTIAPPIAVYGAQVYPELPGALCVAGIIALAGCPSGAVRCAVAGVVALATAAAWLSIKYVPVAGVAAPSRCGWRYRDAATGEPSAWPSATAAVLGALYAVAHVALVRRADAVRQRRLLRRERRAAVGDGRQARTASPDRCASPACSSIATSASPRGSRCGSP